MRIITRRQEHISAHIIIAMTCSFNSLYFFSAIFLDSSSIDLSAAHLDFSSSYIMKRSDQRMILIHDEATKKRHTLFEESTFSLLSSSADFRNSDASSCSRPKASDVLVNSCMVSDCRITCER